SQVIRGRGHAKRGRRQATLQEFQPRTILAESISREPLDFIRAARRTKHLKHGETPHGCLCVDFPVINPPSLFKLLQALEDFFGWKRHLSFPSAYFGGSARIPARGR